MRTTFQSDARTGILKTVRLTVTAVTTSVEIPPLVRGFTVNSLGQQCAFAIGEEPPVIAAPLASTAITVANMSVGNRNSIC